MKNIDTLVIEIDLSLSSAWVIGVLEYIFFWRGYAAKIRVDNGPEFILDTLVDSVDKHVVQLEFIKPGKPTQNRYVKSFKIGPVEQKVWMFMLSDDYQRWG